MQTPSAELWGKKEVLGSVGGADTHTQLHTALRGRGDTPVTLEAVLASTCRPLFCPVHLPTLLAPLRP